MVPAVNLMAPPSAGARGQVGVDMAPLSPAAWARAAAQESRVWTLRKNGQLWLALGSGGGRPQVSAPMMSWLPVCHLTVKVSALICHRPLMLRAITS